MSATAIILWAVMVSALTAYSACLMHFETTLKREDFRLWQRLVMMQVGALRLARRAVFVTYLFNGDFQNLNNSRISRATYWALATGAAFVVSSISLFWYYRIYLPSQR